MSNRNWVAGAALGAIAGVGIALLFLAWADPGFRYPPYRQIGQQDAKDESGGNYKPIETPGFWKTYTTPADTYAQWIAAIAAIGSVGVSIWAVRLVRNTLVVNQRATTAAEDAVAITREMGEAQTRAYLSVSSVDAKIERMTGKDGAVAPHLTIKVNVINGGQTPARNAYCIGGITSVVKKTETVIAFETRARNEDFLPNKEYRALGHSIEFSDVDLASFKRNDFVIRVHGRITYDPVVGSKGKFVDYLYSVSADRAQDALDIERQKTGNASD